MRPLRGANRLIEKILDERRRRQKMSVWSVIWQAALIGTACWIVLLIAFKIILSADRLGWLFIPVLLGYFALVWAVTDWLNEQKEKREFHGQVGDELYYAFYPKDLIRKQRREARKAKYAQSIDRGNVNT